MDTAMKNAMHTRVFVQLFQLVEFDMSPSPSQKEETLTRLLGLLNGNALAVFLSRPASCLIKPANIKKPAQAQLGRVIMNPLALAALAYAPAS